MPRHPVAGKAAAPTGVVPPAPRREPLPTPSRPSGGKPHVSKPTEGRDARAFLDYVRREGKPGLVSFMGNAFAARIDQGAIHVFFDRRHANLIPMLKNPSHLGQLQELAKACFKRAVDIQFVVGDDPKVGEQNEAEEKALEEVRSNPAIKYLLDEFNGKILNCQILGENND